jgi:riboflavin biosynthesis pyrimidine reductase
VGAKPDPSDRPAETAADSLLRGLIPPAEPAAAAEVVERMGLWERVPVQDRAGRPRVLLNMVSSADGLATLQDRSGGLSSPADRQLFHALRAASDAVLVGAGTLRAERYGRMIRDPAVRATRERRGLQPEPLACVVTDTATLDPATPLLAEPQARVVLLTNDEAQAPDCGAQIEYVRCGAPGALDLAAGLASLGERFGVQLLLCEGGPGLAGELAADGLLDDLFLSLAPKLVGGVDPGGRVLRILDSGPLQPPVQLGVVGAYESDSHLFLHYGVIAPERVSRETIESSSLAR